MQFRTEFNYDADSVSRETGTLNDEVSLTKQSFKDECDINVILERFAITGKLPENVRMPTYADFNEIVDYHSAQNILASAEQSFMQMPANVRARFNHDPQEFIAFCSDNANRSEAASLGLVPPEPTPPEGASPASGPTPT